METLPAPVSLFVRDRAAARRWVMPSPVALGIETLHDHPLLHELLTRRGIRTRAAADAFLDHTNSAIPDPGLLPDLDAAVERMSRAINDDERIAIFGDYDVDGMTSAAIMWHALRSAMRSEHRLSVRLPRRDEGYGLSAIALQEMAEDGVTLLIAVDCASTDNTGVSLAQSLGMDVIIIDHHHMTNTGPPGALTISPARPDGGHYRDMSAAGLTLLTAFALEQAPAFDEFRRTGGAASLFDLAALGTVADVSAMTGHNRLIVREGIRAMRRQPRVGLKTLCEVASIDLALVNTSMIGFGIGPRLNAAGRMADPRPAFDLLLESDPTRAYGFATKLDGLNRLRQVETEQVIEDVLERMSNSPELVEAPILIESDSNWRSGILGLAAGKLVECLGRPVILLREEGGIATGSCRSVPGLHIVDLLRRHESHLERFGGHSQAAGLTLQTASIGAFRQELLSDSVISSMELPFVPELRIDAELTQHQVNLEMARLIMQLSPYGSGNPEPVFVVRDVAIVRTEMMGRDRTHLRMVWRGTTGEIRAPFFSAAGRASEIRPGSRVDVVCTVSVDRWNGQPRVDVKVLDFRPSLPADGNQE